jgi:uncharacterized protein
MVAISPRSTEAPAMPIKVNIQLLEKETEHLVGELPAADIAEGYGDDLITFAHPLHYDLEVERQPQGILVTGELRLPITCQCRRCLKSFEDSVEIPDFAALAPLDGEDAITCEGDFADLTPFLREDIYLLLPTNPLCSPNCPGLVKPSEAGVSDSEPPEESGGSPWAALDQLKL